MRAVCWEGKETIWVETVPDPVILVPRQTRLCIKVVMNPGATTKHSHLHSTTVPPRV